MESRGWTYTFEASVLELYNDTLKDLLTSSTSTASSKGGKKVGGANKGKAQRLIIRSDTKSVEVVGAKTQAVASAGDVHHLVSDIN